MKLEVLGLTVAIQNRFRVHKSDDTVVLQGIISDTTNFKVIDEMLVGSTKFDCSNLLSASWNGIIKFDKYLREINQEITLTNIPNRIFNYLRLMPEVNRQYKLDQVELGIVDVESPSLKIKNIFLSTNDLQMLSNETSKAFLRINKREEIVGREQFICPDKFRKYVASPEAASSKWYKENFEEFDFWFDYCNFSNTTGLLALDLVQSLSDTLVIILKEIELGVQQSEEALRIIKNDYDGNNYVQVESIINFVKEGCHHLATAMNESTQKSKDLLLKMQLLADKEEFSDDRPLYELIDHFCDSTLTLKAILSRVEDIGSDTGARISNLAVVEKLKEIIDNISEDNVTPEILSSFRDVLEIMDPLSEDSWIDTKECYIDHVSSIDKAISDAVILLQGFDLLRQILEHRFSESESIKNYLRQTNRQNWLEIQGNIYELVNKTLVTDQEKYSCEFFIPKAAESDDDKHPPGEVLLF